MNELLPVAPGQVPAHITQGKRLGLNAAAHANVLSSFAEIRFRNARWSIKYRGNQRVMTASRGTGRDGRPLPEEPIPTLDVVVVGMTPIISKRWYEAGYTDGKTGVPDCFSVNGVNPDAAATKKQSTSCAVCEKNRFGSRITNQGKKAKACADYRRIAVVPAGDEENATYGGPMLLGVPAMSLRNLDKYASELDRMGADISEVVTRLSFRSDASYPEIIFTVVGWITPEGYETVREHAGSDEVHRMLESAVVETTTDAEPEEPGEMAKTLGAKPVHLQPAPAPQTQPQAAPVQPRATPFSQQPKVQAATPSVKAETTAAKPAQPAQTKPVKEAPPDMEDAVASIENLLEEQTL